MLFCQLYRILQMRESLWEWSYDWDVIEDEMSVVEDEEMFRVEALRATKYPNFRVATGGKGPPEEPTTNWVAEYEVGTTFCTMKRSSQDCDFELFYVLFKSLPEVMLLKWQLCDGKILDKYVDPVTFSKLFKPGVILGVIKPEASKEDTEDGNSNRSDRPRDLVLHEAVPGEHQLLEDEEQPDL